MALRRTVKNVVKNYTDIEVKVRKATSNDPWGPSSSLMGDIADATYNVTDFSEIMGMLWKRINDHGKNWRHVYKALTVLEYIIKTGSERVAQQCRENIYAIQTLKDFQYIDKDGKDQGMNVREKSKQLVGLLRDEDRLKNERQRALKAKERFAQSQGGVGNSNFKANRRFGSGPGSLPSDAPMTKDDSSIPSSGSWDVDKPTEFDRRSADGRVSSELEKARPSNEAEEAMQIQIALEISKVEAAQEKKLQIGDEERFKRALRESQKAPGPYLSPPGQAAPPFAPSSEQQLSTLLDLSEPSVHQQPSVPALDPWAEPVSSVASGTVSSDPWAAPSSNSLPVAAADPWGSQPVVQSNVQTDPWSTPTEAPAPDPWSSGEGNFDSPYTFSTVSNNQEPLTNGFDPRGLNNHQQPPVPGNPFDMTNMESSLPVSRAEPSTEAKGSFLGDTSRLVNLDNILGDTKSNTSSVSNPFTGHSAPKATNPFLQEKQKPKSMNEIMFQRTAFSSPSGQDTAGGDILLPAPLVPENKNTQSTNPFM